MTTLSPHASNGNMPQKVCTKCGRTLPATNEFFVLAKKNKDGLTSICKDCNNVACRLKHPDAKPRGKHFPQVNVPEGQMRCTLCKNIFPATPEFFNRNKRTKSGLYWQCKSCKQQLDNAYQSRPEVQAHIRAHRESLEFRELTKSYRLRPDVHERERANVGNRRARKISASGFHTPEQIQEQYERQKHKCYYCQHKVKWGKHHVDHVVPLSRGGSNDISNLVITCAFCNLSKRARMPHEWPQGGRLL